MVLGMFGGMQSVLLGAIKYQRVQAQRRVEVARKGEEIRAKLLQQQRSAELHVALLVAASGERVRVARAKIDRVTGGWRCSTLSGYLRGGDDIYKKNFRMTRESFDALLVIVQKTAFAAFVTDDERVRDYYEMDPLHRPKLWGARALFLANAARDHPDTRYKLAACLYLMGQGGRLKQVADVASQGESSLRRWIGEFCDAVVSEVAPIYMSRKPFTAEERQAISGQFASRRGIRDVLLAVDGSHIHYFPGEDYATMLDYKNYKGWTSILAVAFVDSFYRFFDLDVGYPGRAGDNTVLKDNWLMAAIRAEPEKWLGSNGFVISDTGASDADSFLMNPYHQPTDPSFCWFNFCHSSTRFFVEETFGRWKNRWRFLIDPCHTTHALTTRMIYASAILHNFCTVHKRDGLSMRSGKSAEWQVFFAQNQAMLCPSCSRRDRWHCPHQAMYRLGTNGASLVARQRKAPSEVREEVRKQLWNGVLDGSALSVVDDEIVDAESPALAAEIARVRGVLHDRVAARRAGATDPTALRTGCI